MKKFKTAAALGAAIITTGLLSTAIFAEDINRVYIKAAEGSIDDTVSVSIVIDSDTYQLSALSFTVNYDAESLELQGEPIVDSIFENGFGTTNSDEKGKVIATFAGFDEGAYFHNREVMKLSFKVLKVNGKITVDVDELNEFSEDAADVSSSFAIENGVVKCSHKNTETKTEITDCEKGGKTVTTCKDCGETVKTEDLAPAKHKVDRWTETKKATCTEEGEKEGVCTVCGKTVTEKLEKSDHQFGEWKVTKPATCTEKGLEERVCELCGVEKETREIKMTEHVIDWKTEKEASCTEAGEKKGVCSICGSEFSEELPALGHDWGEWETVTEPTEDGEGLEQRTCGRCGEKEERPIAKLESSASPEPVITSSESSSGTSDPSTTTVPSATTAPAATTAPGSSASGDKNLPTGAAIAIVPLAAALATVVIVSKKRR